MTYYNEECDTWLRTKQTTVTISSVCRIFGRAYVRSASMTTAANGFKCTSIWPCDRNIWTDADFAAAGRFKLSYSETGIDVPSNSARDGTMQNDNSSNTTNSSASEQQSNNRSLSTCDRQSNDPCPPTNKQQLNELRSSTSTRQNSFRHVTTNPCPSMSDQQSNKPSLFANEQQHSNDPSPSTSEQQSNNQNLSTSEQQSNDPCPSKSSRQSGFWCVATSADGRCFFRAVVICQDLDMQYAERDNDGNLNDLRMRIREMTSADALRSNMIAHILDNCGLYENIDERMVNADLLQRLCYASIEDRIASMANPSEMIGDIEIVATACCLQRPVHDCVGESVLEFGTEFQECNYGQIHKSE